MSSLLVVEACARGAAASQEVTIGDVARVADVAPSTASRLVDRAQSTGLLRVPSTLDARRTALILTAAGAGLQARSIRARLAWLAYRLDELFRLSLEGRRGRGLSLERRRGRGPGGGQPIASTGGVVCQRVCHSMAFTVIQHRSPPTGLPR